jgi:hypothetical protein
VDSYIVVDLKEGGLVMRPYWDLIKNANASASADCGCGGNMLTPASRVRMDGKSEGHQECGWV